MRLLIVDDDFMIRADYKLVLKAAHATATDVVQEAGNLKGALAILAKGGIDGVIADLIGTGGALSVLEMRRRFPAVPVTVLTGDKDAPPFEDEMVRVLLKGDAGPLEARAALAEMLEGK